MNRIVLHLVWGLLLFFTVDISAQSLLNRLEFGISGQALSDYVDLNTGESSAGSKSPFQLAPAAVIRYNSPYRFALRAGFFTKKSNESLDEFEIGVNQEWIPLNTFDSSKEVDLSEVFISFIGEFHFNDFNFYQAKSGVVPYLGIGLVHIMRKTSDLSSSLFDSNVEEFLKSKDVSNDDYENGFSEILKKSRNSVVMTFGGKIKLNRLILSGEFSGGVLIPSNTNETFKDGETFKVKQKNKSFLNDWYVFPNFTITYTFGPNF